jgi:hypothetical protein
MANMAGLTDTAADYNRELMDAASSVPCQVCRAELAACIGVTGELMSFVQVRQLVAGARILAHLANGHPDPSGELAGPAEQ